MSEDSIGSGKDCQVPSRYDFPGYDQPEKKYFFQNISYFRGMDLSISATPQWHGSATPALSQAGSDDYHSFVALLREESGVHGQTLYERCVKVILNHTEAIATLPISEPVKRFIREYNQALIRKNTLVSTALQKQINRAASTEVQSFMALGAPVNQTQLDAAAEVAVCKGRPSVTLSYIELGARISQEQKNRGLEISANQGSAYQTESWLAMGASLTDPARERLFSRGLPRALNRGNATEVASFIKMGAHVSQEQLDAAAQVAVTEGRSVNTLSFIKLGARVSQEQKNRGLETSANNGKVLSIQNWLAMGAILTAPLRERLFHFGLPRALNTGNAVEVACFIELGAHVSQEQLDAAAAVAVAKGRPNHTRSFIDLGANVSLEQKNQGLAVAAKRESAFCAQQWMNMETSLKLDLHPHTI